MIDPQPMLVRAFRAALQVEPLVPRTVRDIRDEFTPLFGGDDRDYEDMLYILEKTGDVVRIYLNNVVHWMSLTRN